MMVYTGDTAGRWLDRTRALGWGRMFCDSLGTPRSGEPWALDNGAFMAWKNNTAWDGDSYLRRVERAEARLPAPSLVVVPDIVGEGERSLEFSLSWRERLPASWPCYLAVQDGMTGGMVAPVLGQFSGIFLGGTDAFKATAREWREVSREHGLPFHYARVSTLRKLRLAFDCGADSIDSARIMWRASEFERFHRSLAGLRVQGVLCEA